MSLRDKPRKVLFQREGISDLLFSSFLLYTERSFRESSPFGAQPQHREGAAFSAEVANAQAPQQR